MATPCMATPCVAILRVAHGKLHETSMFHVTRKRGPHKHVTGIHCSFLMALRMDTQVKMKL